MLPAPGPNMGAAEPWSQTSGVSYVRDSLRELRDEEPESFRGYLRMAVETFDVLLHLVEDQLMLNRNYQIPISARNDLP